jgi:hypothetical protein
MIYCMVVHDKVHLESLIAMPLGACWYPIVRI